MERPPGNSAPTIDIDEILRPPTDEEVARAIAMFAEAVRAHYGDRLKGLYLFGSRARGDHHPDSDADIAVVLADGGWDLWSERMQLSDMAFDAVCGGTAHVQGWPIGESEWSFPNTHRNPRLIEAMHRDAKAVGTPS